MRRLTPYVALLCLLLGGNAAFAGPAVALRINCLPSPNFPPSGQCFDAQLGVPFTFWVIAIAGDSSVASDYVGTVHISSSDPRAILPADYTFTTADHGIAPFVMTFRSVTSSANPSLESVTATDALNNLTVSKRFRVFYASAVPALSTIMLCLLGVLVAIVASRKPFRSI